MDLQNFYQERIEAFSEKAAFLKAKYNRYSIIRLIVFLGGLILIALLATVIHWSLTILLIAVSLAGFSRFVNWHQKINEDYLHHQALSTVNKNELDCINDNYSAYENGEEFIDPGHPFTVDLDIFGDYSFFQYINRTATIIGKMRLAEFLKNNASRQEITLRQEAISEIKDKTEWRHHFQARGIHTKDSLQHIQLLNRWISAEPFVINNNLYKFAPFIVPILITAGTFFSLQQSSWYYFIISILPSAYILRKTFEKVSETHQRTSKAEKTLAYYSKMIDHIESGTFESSKLKNLKTVFLHDHQSASKSIKRLSYIISQLNVRYNAFVIILNVFMLWDLIWIRALENWKVQHSDRLDSWFKALQEFEAINSFGNLYFNNPEWIFPTINESSQLKGDQLGHPLINREKRVCNDLQMPTQGHIKLVTGSNMAGKSTFLRTVGLNIALAMTGSPVCAKNFELPMMRVFTSMRTQDALHESTSSFYAELKRLKFIIEEVEDRKNAETDVFFLLDEILKGTNSKDRHTGSKALIRQLIKSKGSGIIATHDLELAALEAESDGTVENLCIEVEVKGDKLFFDYTIKPGVSQSFNATQLMRSMGIRI